ncbi:D-alanyl-D-alanine carboxypeptidase/D-alanyl-D-alanine-endopeptidase [Roseivirga sp.]|uniref:D-alanyl-D-alanine carboxypeptidase/D-alanyl-D-alanine-endopeptidase n=1 Tax=Roseivirga sp. TaxID=1964215 RepID=UPI002B26A406|nr:D-alanyl-D-alanine carboxypeptidase [Roseivirga sp.]
MSKGLLIIFLSLICGLQSLQAQKYSKKRILKDLKELPGFEQAFVGFMLVDPKNEKTIVSQFDDKYMTPASNTKLFTLYAGLHFLGNNIPALQYIIKNDSLIFWGTGNPLFLHPEYNDTTALHFLKSHSENLYYWPRPMEDDRLGPGWGWDDYNGYYSAEKSVFPIYGNSVMAYLNKEEKTIKVSPSYLEPQFIFKKDSLIRLKGKVQRDEMKNSYEYTFPSEHDFDIVNYSPIDTLVRPFLYSSELFVQLLSDTLDREVTIIKKPENVALAQTLYASLTDSLYKSMLQESDNLFAEQVLLMASGLETDTLSTASMIKKTKELMFNDEQDELVWVDGSGLSRYNMFTPRTITNLLLKLHKELGEERLFELLPVGGISGTLKDWYAGENEPYIYAKSGTLRNNYALSGYLRTERGKTLIFSFIVNHYEESTDKVRKSIETVLRKIRASY